MKKSILVLSVVVMPFVVLAEEKLPEKSTSAQNVQKNVNDEQHEKNMTVPSKTKEILDKFEKQKMITSKIIEHGDVRFLSIPETKRFSPAQYASQYVSVPKDVMDEIIARIKFLEEENRRLKSLVP